MIARWYGCLIGLAVLATTSLCMGEGVTLYVSTQGNDKWSGTLAEPNAAKTDGPFATLEHARDQVRTFKKAGGLPNDGIVVEVRGGVYERDKTFELTQDDSGTPEARIVYRARKGEEVRLVGGKVVRDLKPVTDPAILKRLAEPARGKVLQADLRAQGVSDFGKTTAMFGKRSQGRLELFYNDKPMTLARWPNEGFVKIVEVLGKTLCDVRGTKGCVEGVFRYEGDRPKRWADENDAWVHGYWFHDWSDERHKVASIDTEKRTIAVCPPYHGYGYRKGKYFYALNILAELDRPGEWYLDRQSAILYFWPPGDGPVENGKPMVSILGDMVLMTDVSHVTLRGFLFEAAQQSAILMQGGTRNEIVGCTIRNLGNTGVSIRSGTKHGVIGCDIYDVGNTAISMNGGNRKTLAPGGHFAENNHIHHYGRWNRMYQKAVAIYGVGNRAAHNLMHNAPHQAVGFGGNEHVIECNEIHSVCHESNDAGAIYAGRNWTMRGHIIRYNYMHHVCGFEGRGCVGIYLDDAFSSAHIYGNVFYKVTRAAFVGGGRDSVIENNIFVDCPRALHIDARGIGWAHQYIVPGGGWHMQKKLKDMNYNQPPYSTRYKHLADILEDDPYVPKYTLVARNVFVGEKWDDIHKSARPHVTLQDNLVGEDPRFVEPPPKSFALRDDSPAFKLGFQRIPLKKIGLYQDERRASWPVTHTVRPMPEPPKKKPLRKGPAPVFKVRKTQTPITVDGVINPAEWNGADAKAAMVIQEGVHAEKLKPVSRAWLAHDGAKLYIAIRNDVDPGKPLAMGAGWGKDDAVEAAIRAAMAEKTAPIYVLRGYPNGRFESSTEAGAPADLARTAGKAVTYAAKVIDPGHWSAEYCIPLAALGLEPKTGKKFAFNITARKTAGSQWIMWLGTGGYSWAVEKAGFVKLAP